MKTLVSTVRADNPNFSDAVSIEGYVIELHDHLVERILELADGVREMGAYYITTFHDGSLTVSSWLDEEDIIENPERIDLVELHVSATQFWFTAYPKHATSDMQFTTDRHELEELVDNPDES